MSRKANSQTLRQVQLIQVKFSALWRWQGSQCNKEFLLHRVDFLQEFFGCPSLFVCVWNEVWQKCYIGQISCPILIVQIYRVTMKQNLNCEWIWFHPVFLYRFIDICMKLKSSKFKVKNKLLKKSPLSAFLHYFLLSAGIFSYNT